MRQAVHGRRQESNERSRHLDGLMSVAVTLKSPGRCPGQVHLAGGFCAARLTRMDAREVEIDQIVDDISLDPREGYVNPDAVAAYAEMPYETMPPTRGIDLG